MRFASFVIKVVPAITLLLLVGCSSTPKPPIAQISLNVQPNINLYSDGVTKPEARPVVIRVYELKSLAAFNATDFFTVFHNYNEALNTELLSSEEFQLAPGKKLKFDRTLNLGTRYVGVVSAFRDLEHAQWRAAVAIPAKESAPEIYILLKGNKVMIGAKRQCSFICRLRSSKPPVGSLYESIEHYTE